MAYNAKVLGTGMFVPERIMTNKDLEKIVETNDEWIFERTGIRERRVSNCKPGEFPADMAQKASEIALKHAGLKPNDIDLILFGTCTPDYKLPNSATHLQTKLGITNQCGCLDINAACSGFVYGFNLASTMVHSGAVKNVLIVGSELLTPEVDWEDRGICILFGDGCGAAIVGPGDESSQVLSFVLGADGTGREFFKQEHGGSVSPMTHEILESKEKYFQMQGQEMFRVAVRALADNAKKSLELAGYSADDVDWVIPHQANIRIIEATAKRLGMSLDKWVINIDKYGNTSAATVPIAFHEAIADGRIKRGDLVLFDAFGAGLTSGATVLRY